MSAWPRGPEKSGASTARWITGEWVAEDVKVGKRTSFPRSVKLKPSETVVFSWIAYKGAHRDRVNKKVMADPRLKDMMDLKTLPFDAKRMIYGGFESLVKA